MGNYNTLVPQAGYLSNVRLKVSPANGVTQGDLDAGQAHAKATVDAQLSGVYDTLGWDSSTPPIIERIADMLSSAEVLEYKYQRGDTAEGDDTNLPSVLRDDAAALLAQIRRGAVSVVAAGGSVVARLAGDALPSAATPEAQFFPASSRTTSFGQPTRQSLEEVYRTRGR
jgi:hypothetical protein